jgi:DNA-damage-inducible protein D
MSDLDIPEPHRHTMERLNAAKHISEHGIEYWLARQIGPILGYERWDGFEPVIRRAMDAMQESGADPSHQIRLASKMMARGNGAQQPSRDYYLTRGACYLVALNGDPSKPEVAAAQVYFAVQTRRMEQVESLSEDQRRLELRDKVADSFKSVSSVAQRAGVRNERQAIFHEQRYRGLFDARGADVKAAKGLNEGEKILDRAGPLELSAHDFQI